MAATPDVRPVGDLPDEIGRTAAGELSVDGTTSVERVADHSKKELLAIHGVGPKPIARLGEALATKGLEYRAAGTIPSGTPSGTRSRPTGIGAPQPCAGPPDPTELFRCTLPEEPPKP